MGKARVRKYQNIVDALIALHEDPKALAEMSEANNHMGPESSRGAVGAVARYFMRKVDKEEE